MQAISENNSLNIPTLDLPRVVIIGGGFAGLKMARNIDSDHLQTVLLDENNYHTFQPLMYQVATAGLEPDSIAYPLRKTLKKKRRTHIRMTKVERIDTDEKKVFTSIGDIKYDHLIIATGAVTNYFGNESIARNAMPMKSLTESLDIRSSILQNFEEALTENDEDEKDALMNFVIVGGGPTGVELAGAFAELKKHVLPKDYPDLDLRRMQIHLMEAGPKLLAAMSQEASENALKYLRKMDINVWTDTLVKEYDGYLIETSKENFQSKNLIWAAGVKGNVPNGISDEHLVTNRIKVNQHCEVEGLDGVYAIGDVAVMETENNPEGLPMLASVAQQQGHYLAKMIKRNLNEKAVEPFTYKDKGTMATVGRNRAVVDLGRIRFGGLFAWLIWLLVHLLLLIDFRSKIIVFVNWVWSYVNFDRGTRLIVRKYQKRKVHQEN